MSLGEIHPVANLTSDDQKEVIAMLQGEKVANGPGPGGHLPDRSSEADRALCRPVRDELDRMVILAPEHYLLVGLDRPAKVRAVGEAAKRFLARRAGLR